MAIITDDYMNEMRSKARRYTLVLLTATPALRRPEVDPIIWEHGRRNHSLRVDGDLAIVCPVEGDGDLRGIGIFRGTPEEVARIMDDDPGVKTGIFSYELRPVRGFPGDCLPA
jgi:hypothetical protein